MWEELHSNATGLDLQTYQPCALMVLRWTASCRVLCELITTDIIMKHTSLSAVAVEWLLPLHSINAYTHSSSTRRRDKDQTIQQS